MMALYMIVLFYTVRAVLATIFDEKGVLILLDEKSGKKFPRKEKIYGLKILSRILPFYTCSAFSEKTGLISLSDESSGLFAPG